MFLDLTAALADLHGVLGSHLDRGRADGVFRARVLGPGSLSGLADLAPTELHLDLLSDLPTEAQRAALSALGYLWEGERRAHHPGSWILVLADHATSEAEDPQALHDGLAQGKEVQARYRAAFVWAGRAAAEAALLPEARRWALGRVGFTPVHEALWAPARPTHGLQRLSARPVPGPPDKASRRPGRGAAAEPADGASGRAAGVGLAA